MNCVGSLQILFFEEFNITNHIASITLGKKKNLRLPPHITPIPRSGVVLRAVGLSLHFEQGFCHTYYFALCPCD